MMGSWAMKRRLNMALRYVLLAVAAVVVVFPIYYAVATSLFTAPETLLYPPKFFTTRPYWDSYREALRRAPVFLFIRNSFLVSVGVTFGQLVTSSLAAYAFTFLRFRGRDALFFVILSTMMIPWEVTLVPNYMLINKLGWVDTFQGLIVPFLADAFGIFLLRQSGIKQWVVTKRAQTPRVAGVCALFTLKRVVTTRALLLEWAEKEYAVGVSTSTLRRAP